MQTGASLSCWTLKEERKGEKTAKQDRKKEEWEVSCNQGYWLVHRQDSGRRLPHASPFRSSFKDGVSGKLRKGINTGHPNTRTLGEKVGGQAGAEGREVLVFDRGQEMTGMLTLWLNHP